MKQEIVDQVMYNFSIPTTSFLSACFQNNAIKKLLLLSCNQKVDNEHLINQLKIIFKFHFSLFSSESC